MKKVDVAVIGFGTVGSGVAEIIINENKMMTGRTGLVIDLKYILDIRNFSNHPLADKLVKSIDTIADDPEITSVVEAIGGIEPGYSYTKRCLAAGKNVITSNKQLVAEHGTELLALAKQNGVRYMFEAAVGGATPTIAPLRTTLAAGKVIAISGIVNGTTNFMLTGMLKNGMSYAEALSVAQQLGYAETKDPSDDVDGYDAGRKLAILSSIAYGMEIKPDDIPTDGISEVSLSDMKLAAEKGGTIKLIAHSEQSEDGNVSAWVHAAYVGENSRFISVNDVFNSVHYTCSNAGDVELFGRGAGKLPTAGAVMADVIEASENSDNRPVLWTKQENPFKYEVPYRYFVIKADGTSEITGKMTVAERDKMLSDGIAAKAYIVIDE